MYVKKYDKFLLTCSQFCFQLSYPHVVFTKLKVKLLELYSSTIHIHLTVVIESLDSLWMNCKSEFSIIFLRCFPRRRNLKKKLIIFVKNEIKHRIFMSDNYNTKHGLCNVIDRPFSNPN